MAAVAAALVGSAANAACPTANSGFTAYQADIDLDGVPDILFRPKPLVIVVPLGADDDLIPLALDPGLPGFNVVSGGGSGAPLGPVPANAVVVSYQATVMTGEAGSCGLVALRSTTAGLPTLIVSFGTGASGASTTPKLVQTLASTASASTKTTYTYDARNRLVGTTYGDGSPSISRSYTPDGLLASISSNGSTWTYGYNRRRLLQQETLSFGGSSYSIGRGYDANGHLSQLSYPDGTAVGYSPNALGQPSQVSGYASAVSWHPNGALANFTYANGIAHTLTQNTRGLPQQSTDAGVIQDQYAFDANANVTAITDALQGVSNRGMGYDALDRLTTANSTNVWGNGSYAYDPLDNLRASTVGARSTTHNYDGANRLASLNTNGTLSALSYDAQGNVSAKGSRNYIFDQGNRLLASGSSSYTYDGLGRRTAATGSDGKRRVQVYGRGGQLLYGSLTPVSGAPSAIRYIYLSGSVIAETDSAGTTYLHTDGLGSPIARTNAAKAVTSRTRYEPYGATAAGTNPGTGIDNVGFTGHANDPDTGLVYMQQRYYDPVAGRFLSTDPVITDATSGASFNRYTYADNSPYVNTDPDGRQSASEYANGLSSCRASTGNSCGVGDRQAAAPAKAANAPGGQYFDPSWHEVGVVVETGMQMASFWPPVRLGATAVTVAAKGVSSAIPKVGDAKLGNIVSDLYKGARGPNPIGTGSTADAIRNEAATGLSTGGRFHKQKGTEYIRALENWQTKNPNASHYDRMVAESLKNDLRNALGK